jgi:hypothetical protein
VVGGRRGFCLGPFPHPGLKVPFSFGWKLLSYDPNSVSQEKGRLLTERSGGAGGGSPPPRYGTGHKYPLGFSIRD